MSTLLCSALNRPHYRSFPSARLSGFSISVPYKHTNLNTKKCRKSKIGVNVSFGSSYRCASFLFKRLKFRVEVVQFRQMLTQ